jgi:hypothetical protein
MAARDAAAEEKLAARDAAAAAERNADIASIRVIVLDASKVTGHQMRSVTAGLMRVPGGVMPAPALWWSAAEVSAWFATSAHWKQYERHFAAYDGNALFTLTSEQQLAEAGVLPSHTAALLADLMALE